MLMVILSSWSWSGCLPDTGAFDYHMMYWCWYMNLEQIRFTCWKSIMKIWSDPFRKYQICIYHWKVNPSNQGFGLFRRSGVSIEVLSPSFRLVFILANLISWESMICIVFCEIEFCRDISESSWWFLRLYSLSLWHVLCNCSLYENLS